MRRSAGSGIRVAIEAGSPLELGAVPESRWPPQRAAGAESLPFALLNQALDEVRDRIAVVYRNINDAGMGEIMVMMAIMIASYAQVLWRRAVPMGVRQSTTADGAAHPL